MYIIQHCSICPLLRFQSRRKLGLNPYAGVFEQSMGAGNRGGIGFRISLPETVFLNFSGARNRFQGIDSASLCSLAVRYDNPIPTWFLAP